MSVASLTPAAMKCNRRPSRWPWLAAGALLAVLLLCYVASLRTPAGPDHGVSLLQPDAPEKTSPQSSSAARRFRLGTFNIHGGVGDDGRLDLLRTVHNLRGLDLAGLNEVHGAWLWDPCDQAESLAQLLGRPWLFAPTEARWFHYEFGNAVVSRLPVTSWQRIPLPRRYARSHRNLLLLAVDFGGTRVNVVVTHLDRDAIERPEQLRVVSEFFLSLAEPAVLMGDLNTPADDPGLKRLLAAPGVVDAVGHIQGSQTPPRIDWILLRGLHCVDAGFVRDGASDHPLAWADIELPLSQQPCCDVDVGLPIALEIR